MENEEERNGRLATVALRNALSFATAVCVYARVYVRVTSSRFAPVCFDGEAENRVSDIGRGPVFELGDTPASFPASPEANSGANVTGSLPRCVTYRRRPHELPRNRVVHLPT